MSNMEDLIHILNSYPVKYHDVGNGDILITNPEGKSYYFTITTNKWRAKGKTKRYSSKGLDHFLTNYCLKS